MSGDVEELRKAQSAIKEALGAVRGRSR